MRLFLPPIAICEEADKVFGILAAHGLKYSEEPPQEIILSRIE